jgi:hypothetical protein
MSSETVTFEKEIFVDQEENWHVIASRGYGEVVTIKIDGDSVGIALHLDPSDARQVGLALMDAANSFQTVKAS